MFQAEISRMEKLMYRVSRSYLTSDEDAADAVQETLMKAWEKRNLLKNSAQFKPWVMRILTNQCKDMLRRRRRKSFYPLEEETVAVDMPEMQPPVWEAIAALKPEQRLVLTLHYVDGYAVHEMAAMLGVSANTVKTRMRSARKRLSQILRVEWEDNV